jgi:hypothetical protein
MLGCGVGRRLLLQAAMACATFAVAQGFGYPVFADTAGL